MSKYNHGYVYIIKIDKLFKIGRTYRTPKERMRSIQSTCPNKIKFVYGFKTNYPSLLERFFHWYFKDYHKWGELFSINIKQVEEAIEVLQQLKSTKLLKEKIGKFKLPYNNPIK